MNKTTASLLRAHMFAEHDELQTTGTDEEAEALHDHEHANDPTGGCGHIHDFEGPLSTVNDFLVGIQGDRLVFMDPVQAVTRPEAIRLAAWLAVLADPLEVTFPRVLAAVRNS